MRREPSPPARRYAAVALLVVLLCLAATLAFPPTPVLASTVRLHYEEAFNDIDATEENEVAIKAAFLLRFPDFISWRTTPGDTLHIGVCGDDRLMDILRRLVEQENQSGLSRAHVLVVIPVSDPEAAGRCQILVLGDAETPTGSPSLPEAHKAGILTVGVWKGGQGDTVIHLFRQGNRIRFSIRRSLAEEAGLRISSKLLNLAREQYNQLFLNTTDPARG